MPLPKSNKTTTKILFDFAFFWGVTELIHFAATASAQITPNTPELDIK
jgi:hypothetical protein